MKGRSGNSNITRPTKSLFIAVGYGASIFDFLDSLQSPHLDSDTTNTLFLNIAIMIIPRTI